MEYSFAVKSHFMSSIHSVTAREFNLTSSSSDQPNTTQLSYRDAGVDIDAGDRLIENIKPFTIVAVADGVVKPRSPFITHQNILVYVLDKTPKLAASPRFGVVAARVCHMILEIISKIIVAKL